MMSLSKEYTIEIKFPVVYSNFPDDKVVANQLPENVDMEIESNINSIVDRPNVNFEMLSTIQH